MAKKPSKKEEQSKPIKKTSKAKRVTQTDNKQEPKAKDTTKKDRIHRSVKDHVIGGVFGGLAEFYNIDAVLLRIGYLLLTILSGQWGFFITVYIAAWIIIPEAKKDTETKKKHDGTIVLGMSLIALGAYFLLDNLGFIGWIKDIRLLPWPIIWPLILLTVGLIMLMKHKKNQ
jgi:phage shock protein C